MATSSSSEADTFDVFRRRKHEMTVEAYLAKPARYYGKNQPRLPPTAYRKTRAKSNASASSNEAVPEPAPAPVPVSVPDENPYIIVREDGLRINTDPNQPLPPVRIPKTWAAKARQRPHWIQKILSPDLPASEEEIAVLFKPESFPQNRVVEPEFTRPVTPPVSRAASVDLYNYAAEPASPSLSAQAFNFADEEFSNTSQIEISQSPALHFHRFNRFDRLQELNTLEQEADIPILTPPQEDPQEVSPLRDTLRRLSRSFLREEINLNQRRNDSLNNNRHNSRVDSPGTEQKVDQEDRKLSRSFLREENLNNSRNNSMTSSRRNSRVNSPTAEQKANQEDRKPSRSFLREENLNNSRNDSVYSSRRNSRADSPAAEQQADPEERIAAEAKLFELQDNKSERNSWSAPSRPRSISPPQQLQSPEPIKVDHLFSPAQQPQSSEPVKVENPSLSSTTQKPKAPEPAKVDPFPMHSPIHHPTPKVTGAYIETPIPLERKPLKDQPSSPSISSVESLRRPDSPHPRPLINTAKLSSAAEDAVLIAGSRNDDTLDNFATALPIPPAPIEDLYTKLGHMHTNIREANQGLGRLQEEVSKLPEPLVTVIHHHHHHHLSLRLPPVPDWLYYSLFIFFGIIAFGIFAESLACAAVCRPVMSSTNSWTYGAPTWGSALSSVIGRASRGFLSLFGMGV